MRRGIRALQAEEIGSLSCQKTFLPNRKGGRYLSLFYTHERKLGVF